MGNKDAVAEECRDKGRQLFRDGNYKEAIKQYDRALKHCPEEPSYYTNRALCSQKVHGTWAVAREDCQSCLAIDPKNVKAHYFLAKAHLEAEEFHDAIIHFNMALEFAIEKAQTKELRDELYEALQIAKKRSFVAEEEHRIARLHNLKENCKRLLEADAEASRDPKGTKGKEPRKGEDDLRMQIALLENLCMRETQKVKSRDIPDCFCCKISMDVMKDPVVTPAGHSYDRRCLMEHLRTVGAFEPTTRDPLTMAEVTPNYNLRAAINNFLEANPWAYPG